MSAVLLTDQLQIWCFYTPSSACHLVRVAQNSAAAHLLLPAYAKAAAEELLSPGSLPLLRLHTLVVPEPSLGHLGDVRGFVRSTGVISYWSLGHQPESPALPLQEVSLCVDQSPP